MDTYTAFPKTERGLRQWIRHVDHESFKVVKITPCSGLFSRCRGLCCSTPVAITEEENEVLSKLVVLKKDFFKEVGIIFNGRISYLVPKAQRIALAKKRRGFRELLGIMRHIFSFSYRFPRPAIFHLAHTCIFSCQNGFCSLQLLGVNEGRHKWYYKPINCWKFPIGIDRGQCSMPQNFGEWYFPCANQPESGMPAREGLKEEISFLNRLSGSPII